MKKAEKLALLYGLADELGVDLADQRVAIATARKDATARMFDGSLEAKVIPTSRGSVEIETPRGSGIMIDLVDHKRDSLAPKEAVYVVKTYMPSDSGNLSLNGDVASVYVGPQGIILNGAARMRAANLYAADQRAGK